MKLYCSCLNSVQITFGCKIFQTASIVLFRFNGCFFISKNFSDNSENITWYERTSKPILDRRDKWWRSFLTPNYLVIRVLKLEQFLRSLLFSVLSQLRFHRTTLHELWLSTFLKGLSSKSIWKTGSCWGWFFGSFCLIFDRVVKFLFYTEARMRENPSNLKQICMMGVVVTLMSCNSFLTARTFDLCLQVDLSRKQSQISSWSFATCCLFMLWKSPWTIFNLHPHRTWKNFCMHNCRKWLLHVQKIEWPLRGYPKLVPSSSWKIE